MTTKAPRFALCAVFVAALSACGGGGGGDAGGTATAQSAKLQVLMSDASSEDWATIGVKVLSIALVPQGGAAPVTVYTAPSAAPVVNLAQLDQLGELIGDVSIPAGTYTSATVTISANPGDVLLTTSADPEPGFAAAASTTIPSSQIQIQGARGAAGSKTVPVQIGFAMPLVVSATQSNALDLEFDLAHPAFIVAHDSPLAGSTIWAVNFNGPLRHHPIERLADLVLRHSYGTVSAVSADNTAITFDKVLPTLPVQGSYFISTDIGALGFRDDGAFCRFLTTEIGVAAIPTSAFYADPSSAPPFARFCFAKKRATLEAARERLQRLRERV